MHALRSGFYRRVPKALLAGLLLALAALPGLAAADDDDAPLVLHDLANPEAGKLQRPAEALSALPQDKRGQVDWMKALRQKLIKPWADLKGEQAMPLLQLDIVMKNTAEMPHVRFPHDSHTQWLSCGNCHSQIFVPKAGANPVTMARIFRGEYCGVCHGRVAFSTLFACERCHSVLHSGGKAWW